MGRLIGFAPDLPPETPGVMTECSNMLPCIGKFDAAPSKKDAGLGALDGPASGFAVVTKNDGTRRILSGTATKLYEVVSGAWANVSKSGGYALGADTRWRFAQFGNRTIAASKEVIMQASTSGNFADLSASAPKAAIVATLNNQVFAFNTNDTGFGDSPDRWWCSALGNETDWVPSVATQCISGRLMSSPGAITAAKPLGAIMVAYKTTSMYVGQNVETAKVWDWQAVPGRAGTPCNEAVVDTGTAHYFIGPDNFYTFDGSRPTPLESPLRKWFFDTLDDKYSYRILSVFDRINKRIFWWFPSKSSNGVPSACIVLNVKTGQWGRMDGAIEAAAEYIAPGVTIDGLDTLYPTIADLPSDISFDSPAWLAGAAIVAAFGSDHKAYTYSGTPTASGFTSGHHGDNNVFSTCSLVKPRFLTNPTSSQIRYSYSETDASTFIQNLTVPYLYNWYDVLWSSVWHKFEFQFTGPVSISGYDVTLTQDGVQ